MENLQAIFDNLKNAGVPTRPVKAIQLYLRSQKNIVPLIYADDFIVKYHKEDGEVLLESRYPEQSIEDIPLALEVTEYLPLLESVLAKEVAAC